MNVKRELEKEMGATDGLQLNDIELEPLTIKAIMINEIVPYDPTQDFYGKLGTEYLKTTIPLFQKEELAVSTIQDIL